MCCTGHWGVASPVSGACVVSLVKSMVDEVVNHSVVVKVLAVIITLLSIIMI